MEKKNDVNWLHWRSLSDTNYLRAETLEPGKELVLTIKEVKPEKVTTNQGVVEEKPVVHFEEPNILPMVLNVTNCKTIEKLYSSGNIYDWYGKKVQVFATTTKVAGQSVPCLRIRNFIPKGKETEYKCTICGNNIEEKTFTASIAKYGKAYCSKECLDKDINGEQII